MLLKLLRSKLSLALIVSLLGVVLYAQGRGTPSQIRVNVDANGYLLTALAAQTAPITSVQFNNARLAVDASGNLLVTGGSGAGFAPADATYITQTANSGLSAEQALASLATGLMISTTTTGVVSTIAPTDDNLPVGNGTAWQLKALTSCSTATSAITYNTTTNAFGCNSITGTPGGNTTEVQYNNAGAFAGDSGFTFTAATDRVDINGHTAIGSGAILSDTETLTVAEVWTSLATTINGLVSYHTANIAVNAIGNISGGYFGVEVPASTDKTFENINGSYSAIYAGGLGNIDGLTGAFSEVYHYGGGTASSIAGVGSYLNISSPATSVKTFDAVEFDNTAAVTAFYGFHFLDATNGGGGSIGTTYAFYSKEISSATNNYFLWYDGDPGTDCNGSGVFRVNDFGILAYYNPCFAKYSPGAADFERIIVRWGDTGVFGADNRAYIGVEEGGTGTDRPVNLIGANYSITSTLTPAVTDTSADSCGTGTQTIVGNDNAGKVTVIGSVGTSCTVTFATAFTNAPSCSVSNETTANLSRAISTTTTVILAGVFAQNDVLAYTCIGR